MMLINTILGLLPENQRGYNDKQLESAKVSMDEVFYLVFAKPPDKNTSKGSGNKDENTYILRNMPN